MSWLNFNDSLSNLRGQLSNLASGVLSDSLVGETGDDGKEKKLEDLERLITTQANEIRELRKVNSELQEKLGSDSFLNVPKKISTDVSSEWFWEPDEPKPPQQPNEDVIHYLKEQIIQLENEKKDLIASLEQLDLDCQQTTEKVITLKDALQVEHNNLQEKFDILTQDHKKLFKLKEEEEKKIEKLQLQIKELQKYSSADGKLKELELKNVTLEKQIEEMIQHHEQFKKDIQINLEKEGKKEERIQELETLLKAVNEEKKKLFQDIELAKMKHLEYESRIENYQSGRITDQEEYDKLSKILQGYEDQVRVYKEKCIRLESEINMSKVNTNATNNEEDSIYYVTILSEIFQKFMDYPVPIESTAEEVNSFTCTVESIMKHSLELKYKAETLQKKVDSLLNEKKNILREKNEEIEKLLENSELLSQEVIAKNEALKHYEEERHELMKNNDILISELEDFRNNSGLHTISESNEDNLILLENQLESANKRIKELETILQKKELTESDANIQSELTYTKEQLATTKNELDKTKEDYRQLLEIYNAKDMECKSLTTDFEKVKESYSQCFTENETLNDTVDKIQTEYEHSEHKYSEININMETLKEEAENLQIQIDTLTKRNKKLEQNNIKFQGENEISQNEIEDLKQTLSVELQTREELENEIRFLKEKLQSIKMSETALKLHYDKDLQSLRDLNRNTNLKLEEVTKAFNETQEALEKLNFEHAELNINYKSLEEEYKKVEETLLGKEEEIRLKDEVILRLKNEISQLKGENERMHTLERKNSDVEMKLVKEKHYLEEKVLSLDRLLSATQTESEKKILDLESTNTLLQSNHLEKIKTLEMSLTELTQNNSNLISSLTAKHEESHQYYVEIQRLNQVLALEVEKNKKLEEELKIVSTRVNENLENQELKNKIVALREENDKIIEKNAFLQSKCDVLGQTLLEEQENAKRRLEEHTSVVSEKEVSLSKELQRLRDHLLEIEDQHTQEMMLADKRSSELQAKLAELEQREKEATFLHTSVNIRTNQHVETLQNQLQLVTNQRDELRRKMSDAEDKINKQTAGLANLEFVLRQFQEDKEKGIQLETERIRRQITVEKAVQDDLRKELAAVRNQLDESKQGLLAASRLSDQVEASKHQIASLKDELSAVACASMTKHGKVQRLQEKLQKTEAQNASGSQEAKVDKMLIKNLIIGFISSNNVNLNKDQHQILKIISTVLDFNQQDNDKVKLNKSNQGSWLGSVLHTNVLTQNQKVSQESLSQAFVRFLENESKPRQFPNLLDTNLPIETSGNSTPQPLLLNEVVLPTFAEFGQSRNSSSILKDVLKDNN